VPVRSLALAVALGFACGAEERVASTACCHYVCRGSRASTFSSYFASADECSVLATERCALAEGNDGVAIVELEPVQLQTGDGALLLSQECAARFIAFRARTSTVN